MRKASIVLTFSPGGAITGARVYVDDGIKRESMAAPISSIDALGVIVKGPVNAKSELNELEKRTGPLWPEGKQSSEDPEEQARPVHARSKPGNGPIGGVGAGLHGYQAPSETQAVRALVQATTAKQRSPRTRKKRRRR